MVYGLESPSKMDDYVVNDIWKHLRTMIPISQWCMMMLVRYWWYVYHDISWDIFKLVLVVLNDIDVVHKDKDN